MIEIIAALALSFGAGYFVGHENPTVSCLDATLIETNCVELDPPTDPSFGATTSKLIEVVGQYRKCKAACEASK